MKDDEEELYPISKPSNITDEDEYSDPINWAAVCEQ